MLAGRGDGTIFPQVRTLPPSSIRHRDMNALVRRAAPEDAESIATVHIESWQTAYRGQLPDPYLDQLDLELVRRTEFWRMHIATPRPNTEIWVACGSAHAEGFAALGPARDADPNSTGEVYAIYVQPRQWNQGLGRALFTHATNRLASLGFSTAILWVLESNARARRFYEIAGWSLDGATKLETLPGGIELREVSYRIMFRHRNEE